MKHTEKKDKSNAPWLVVKCLLDGELKHDKHFLALLETSLNRI